jgi:transposase
MVVFAPGAMVHLALGSTDLRKSINGLSLLVAARWARDPLSGDLFVFCNRRRTMVKVLYWDRNGFCLWQKRLEKDRFRWPNTKADMIRVGSRELMWLLAGLEMEQKGAHGRLGYQSVY